MENEKLRSAISPSWGKHNMYGITPTHEDQDWYSDNYVLNQDTTIDSPNEVAAPVSRNPKTTKHSTNPRAISNVKAWPAK